VARQFRASDGPQPSGLSLSPDAPAVLARGEALQFAAEVRYNDGSVAPATTGVAWTWEGDAEAGTVSAAGLFTAGAGAGTGQVVAALGEWTATSAFAYGP